MDVSQDPSLKARNWKDEFDNYVDASKGLRERILRNFNFYDGIDYGQWENKAALEEILNAGKPAHTFNFIQNLIDTVLGHLKQEPFGITFLQQGKGLEQAGDVMQSLYEMDYERGHFQKEMDEWVRNLLIGQGVMQFIWDSRDDRLGNVGMISKNPKHCIIDPYWNSDDIADCRAIFLYSWMTADQIKAFYNTKSEQVDQAISQFEFDTQEHNEPNADQSQPYYDQDGGLYKVIEVHYLVEKSVRKVIDITDNSDAPFDLAPYAEHKDDVLKGIIALENEDWRLIYEVKKISKILTFAPGLDLDLLLEDGDYPLQLGQLPFVFGYYKDNYEKKQGMVDKLIDPAVIFNKRQSLVSHALGASAGAANFFAEKSVFGGDQDRVEDFEKRISMNGQLIELNDDSLKDKRIEMVERPQMPLDILKSTEGQRNLLNDLAMITPGMMGYAEQADESGALYKSKVRQAMIGLESLSDTIKQKMHEMGRLYLKAAKEVYSGPSRKFIDRTTNQEFWINRVLVDSDGNVVPMNFVEQLPEYLIRIEEKRIGKSKREEEIQMQVSMLQYVKNPALAAALEGQISSNLEFGKEAEAKLLEASDEFLQLQLLQMRAQRKQLEQMLAQGAMPQQPQGAPAPQKPQPSPAQALGLA